MPDIVLRGDDGSTLRLTNTVETINLDAPREELIVLDGGLRGLRGEQGEVGPQGPTGATGPAGADGVVQSIVAGTNVTVDVTDPANPIVSASGGGGTGATVSKSITQAAHGFTTGQVVYLNGTTYTLADKDAAATAEAVGVVGSTTTNTFNLITDGFISGLSGLTAGSVYFLGDNGSISIIEPSVVGQISKPLLVADSSTSGYVVNYRGIAISNAVTPTDLTAYLMEANEFSIAMATVL